MIGLRPGYGADNGRNGGGPGEAEQNKSERHARENGLMQPVLHVRDQVPGWRTCLAFLMPPH